MTHEQRVFFDDHFSQSMTGFPYSCQPLDIWIETTMNLNSKLKQGWLQLLHNEKQLFSTTRNANNVSRVKATVKRNLTCPPRRRQHVECQTSRMRKDEQAVQDLLMCLVEFDAQPFDDSKPTLRSLQSGLIASPELVNDLRKALPDGFEQVKQFLEERVFSKNKPLTATIPKNKRLNFSCEQMSDTSTSKINVSQMEKSGLAALIDLAERSGLIELQKALEGRVTQECLALYNVDGSMRKTSKCKQLQLFKLDPVCDKPKQYASLVDMGLIWRLATPTAEDRESRKRDGSDYCWSDYLQKICNIITSRHADASLLVLLNDRYDLLYSIKDDERDRRAAKHRQIPNVFPKSEDAFPKAVMFNKILLNPTNKVRLQKLLKDHLREQFGQREGDIISALVK